MLDYIGKHTRSYAMPCDTPSQENEKLGFVKDISSAKRRGRHPESLRWPHWKLTEAEEGKVLAIIDSWHHSGRKHSGS